MIHYVLHIDCPWMESTWFLKVSNVNLLHEVKRYFLFFGWGLRLNVHDDYVDDNYMELHHFQLGVEV